MNHYTCPVGCPVAADELNSWAWSEGKLRRLSAPTFTPTRWAQ
jgi:hypothetical protein